MVEGIPVIPDYELLCVIGRGAYGEIWLARGLTGALRAVKIVYRKTFESERAFNREFSGMSAFEPISRAHAGFVNILHVGRNDSLGFFYYVMELADDETSGVQIDVADYSPRTLRSNTGALPANECIRLGLLLTEALGALHEHGLTHRDIKPSNIIVVKGAPKLADIGLVASHGQQSFVGTEGYVPPEGPGTPQADLYSLGKVLYEISMGKDRLDFPEVGSDLEERADKPQLLGLNSILLKACAGTPARRYREAEEMRRDLESLADGEPMRRKRWPWFLLAILILLSLGIFVGKSRLTNHAKEPSPLIPATVSVETDPSNAMVLLGDRMKRSPARFENLEPGKYPLRVMLQDFDPVETRIDLNSGETFAPPVFKLQHSKGSVHFASQPDGVDFELKRNGEAIERGTTPAILHDLPSGTYDVAAKRGGSELHEKVEIKRGEMTTKIFEFANGSVKIISAPAGAIVAQGDRELGRTPLLLEEVSPGPVAYDLKLDGFKPSSLSGMVEARRQTFLDARLERIVVVDPAQPFENSLGMRFVPVGNVRFCVWETRVKDWAAFCRATGHAFDRPDFKQTETDPVVKVNWRDASDFCEWLTQEERRQNIIEDTQAYRLPTDQEWSLAAGLSDESGATPEERDGKLRGVYSWGKQWPPPSGAGNFADQTAARLRGAIIDGYSDGFATTSPAGSFKPNAAGLYDMAGNVWEWCFDLYKPGSRWGVLRGGSWANSNRAELLTSYRNVVDRNERDVIYGFRCVLAAANPQ
ncbi:MAG: SUMF1/EgtB/PvdO family nonheme iron enzyme [Verrucomicrobiota bacterium]|nr:SUMF1/EgtB/PvdO family nonheme iron enzyme [Verrucomicrobiota bacterium]